MADGGAFDASVAERRGQTDRGEVRDALGKKCPLRVAHVDLEAGPAREAEDEHVDRPLHDAARPRVRPHEVHVLDRRLRRRRETGSF